MTAAWRSFFFALRISSIAQLQERQTRGQSGGELGREGGGEADAQLVEAGQGDGELRLVLVIRGDLAVVALGDAADVLLLGEPARVEKNVRGRDSLLVVAECVGGGRRRRGKKGKRRTYRHRFSGSVMSATKAPSVSSALRLSGRGTGERSRRSAELVEVATRANEVAAVDAMTFL